MKEVLKVEKLCKDGILDHIDFVVPQGQMIAIMGPSGSGKSTLLYQISGIDQLSEGEVTLCGQKLSQLSEDQKAALRLEKVGFVFQQMYMMKNMSLLENIIHPAIHHHGKKKKREILERASALLKRMGLDKLEERELFSVSGGQLQRACICRSLINQPEIIFADEPTGSLNQRAAQEVLEIFKDLNQKGATILIVTHDSKVAAICDRVLYLIDGKIEGELKLTDNETIRTREEQVSQWLTSMGW